MNWKRTCGALFLTLALLCGLALPAGAAEGPRLTYQKGGGNSLSLTLRGLEGESVYGVQIELIAPGKYGSVTFAPAGQNVFSPECRTVVLEDSTKIVLYLTAQEPLNKGDTLSVGTVTLDQAFTVPSEATVTLLGHELKPLTQADSASFSVSEFNENVPPTPTPTPTPAPTPDNGSGGGGSGGGGGRGGGGGSSRPKLYQVKVATAEHGTVKVQPAQAEAKSAVTVTTQPEEGWSLKELKVETKKGDLVSLTGGEDGRYTFQMPTSDVTVTALFEEEKEQPPVSAPMSFTDVSEADWFYDGVNYVYAHGLMNGMAENVFAPNTTTSRGMIVTVLHRMEGSPAAELSGFPDVPAEEYYALPVGWATANGIVSGYGGNETGTFGPKNNVTREQLAAILYRYAQKKGLDTSARGDLSVFTDQEAILPYAVEPLSWAVGVGLLNGMGDGTILPGGNATRAQVATILARYCQGFLEK